MTTPESSGPPTLQDLSNDQQKIMDLLGRFVESQGELNLKVNNLLGELANHAIELDGKIDGIRGDIALVRGVHARNVMAQNLPRIADKFDFEFITEMPQQAIIAFAKIAAGQGAAKNDAESFRNADMVINVMDDQGQPAYVAIEASFTVDGKDVDRAVRNANYLRQCTGLHTYPAVVGIHVLDDAQTEVDAGNVLLYQISAGELQPG